MRRMVCADDADIGATIGSKCALFLRKGQERHSLPVLKIGAMLLTQSP
jgi:hypothetical protein